MAASDEKQALVKSTAGAGAGAAGVGKAKALSCPCLAGLSVRAAADASPEIDDPLAEKPPTESRIRFLTRWARLQLGVIDLKSFASRAPGARRRVVLNHVISAAAPCAARVRQGSEAGGADALSRSGLAALASFLNKAEIARLVRDTNTASADEFMEAHGTLDEATETTLRLWHARVLPTVAALPLLDPAPGARCLELAEWSRAFLRDNPNRRQASLFRNFTLKPRMTRMGSIGAESFKSCQSDSSEDELPPDGAENELEHDSDSETEAPNMFQSFLSMRSTGAGGSGFFTHLLGFGSTGPSTWEFARGAEEHGWDEADATQISVRGPTFLSDKKKTPSAESMFELLHVDLFDAAQEGGYPNVGIVPEGLVRELRKAGEERFLFVINFCMPPLQLVGAFAQRDAPVGRDLPHAGGQDAGKELFRRFVEDMDDKERNQRLKIIPWVRQGPWLVQKAVGRTPAIIGKALKVNYFHEPGNYFEASIDIFSSPAAQRILGLLKGAAKALAMEVYFVLEAKASEELPEHVLGGLRVSKGDLLRTRGPI